jgi:hypothetical protein
MVEEEPPGAVDKRRMVVRSSATSGLLSSSRFATPPIQFCCNKRAPGQAQEVPRPRNLGEFLLAAKSRTDMLISSPAVRRRLIELNFQSRRSKRIAWQPVGMDTEQHALHVLLRKLGIIEGDESILEEAIAAYHRLFEMP